MLIEPICWRPKPAHLQSCNFSLSVLNFVTVTARMSLLCARGLIPARPQIMLKYSLRVSMWVQDVSLSVRVGGKERGSILNK